MIEIIFKQTSGLEWLSVAMGVVYILLAIRENSWCWPAAFIGTGASAFLFWDSSLLMESGLNVYYLLMAIYGWWQWNFGGANSISPTEASDQRSELVITRLTARQHFYLIVLIVSLTITSGLLLDSFTSAVLPFLDSFTTWAAVVTTWMVAKKILENWLYWIVINPLALYLCVERELYLYASLYGLYTLLAMVGFINWKALMGEVQSERK